MSSSRIGMALELQVAEVDMLFSMYPNPGEFHLDDPDALTEIKAVVDGKMDSAILESRLGFTIHISSSGKGKSITVELVCQLPHEYPFVKPQVFTRTQDINRERHKQLRDNLMQELDKQDEGEIVVIVLVEWLQERLYTELNFLDDPNAKSKQTDGKNSVANLSFTRLWIYSHHIYSKIKRKDIQDWGSELSLHGFCMPGKPGVICAEGYTVDVDEFWYRIRRMNWKKICIKEQEVVTLSKPTDASKHYKFDPFNELVLDARGGKGREYHMDLGQFQIFLQERGSSHIFKLFFGIEDKKNDDGD